MIVPVLHVSGGTLHANRVEERPAPHAQPEPSQALGQHSGQTGDPIRDGANSGRPVVHGVHARHYGEQHLGRADVAGGLVAPDVLFASLQSHAQGSPAVRIDGHADESSGHATNEFLAGREERGVGAAVAQRRAKALRASQGHVGTELSWGQEQSQAEQVRGHGHARAGSVRAFAEGAVVDHTAVGGGVLHQRPKDPVVKGEALVVAHHDLDSARLGPGRHHRQGLRVAQF